MSCNLLFRGLICLSTEDDCAVFIGSKGHELRLIVKDEDVREVNGFDTDDAHVSELVGRKPRKAYKISGRVLEVKSGAEKVESTFGEDYLKFVPSLLQKSGCKHVRPEVAARKLVSHIGGYLIHPGGHYSVREYYPEKVTFSGDPKDAECISMTTSIALTTNAEDVTIRDETASITVRSNAELLFVNGPIDEADVHEHFQHYFHAIYENCPGGQRPKPVGGTRCELSDEKRFLLPGSDCPNSGYP